MLIIADVVMAPAPTAVCNT